MPGDVVSRDVGSDYANAVDGPQREFCFALRLPRDIKGDRADFARAGLHFLTVVLKSQPERQAARVSTKQGLQVLVKMMPMMVPATCVSTGKCATHVILSIRSALRMAIQRPDPVIRSRLYSGSHSLGFDRPLAPKDALGSRCSPPAWPLRRTAR